MKLSVMKRSNGKDSNGKDSNGKELKLLDQAIMLGWAIF